MPPQTRWAKLPEMVRHGDDLLGALPARLRAVPARVPAGAAGAGFRRGAGRRPALGNARSGSTAEIRGRTPLSAISVMEQRLFLGERLLRDNDAASMAASLEQRVPLVDQVLFESVDRLPDQARYQPLGRKSMLRRIGLRGLDPALFDRPKSGFVLPFDRWIRRGLKDDGPDPAGPAGDRACRARPRRRWSGSGGPSSTARRASTGRGSGRSTS